MMVPPAAEFAQSLDPDRAAPARPDELQARERPALWRLLLDAVWYHRTVRAQLLITVMLIEVVAAVIAGGVTILKARTSTRVEIAASMNLAELLVNETIPLIDQNVPAEQALASLPLHLRFLRHVRISVKDTQGRLVETRPTPNLPDAAKADDRAPAPAWFAALVAPPVETRAVPVIVGGQQIGSVLVVGEPGDESAEVWENTVALASVALVGNVAIIGLLYLLFGRVLGPLSGLARGLRDLERRNYRVRLARPGARELAGIADRFNALAEALDTARAENSRLNHRLITAQDDERRRTALELHDEVGPCLFGLKANATSIAAIAGNLPDTTGGNVRERANDMLGIVDHLQAINRSLLGRLRPMALGHIPLDDLLPEVVRERARQYPHLSISFSAGTLAPSYGDSIDLTIYRCVQEALTNAIRHAEAKTIDIVLEEARIDGEDREPATWLKLAVRDDGRGIPSGTQAGLGLSGMQERVNALGGDCRVEAAPDGGTCVTVAIPLPANGDNGDRGE